MATTVWKNPSFVWLVTGQTISEFGSAITGFALPWLLLTRTGSAMQMGFAFAVMMVPYLLVSLPAGVYADRWNRKMLMMIADGIRLLLVLSIPLVNLFGFLTLAQIYLVLVGMGVCNAVFDSAYVACLPNLVGREQLREANAGLQSGVSASQILGPGLAGVLVGWIGTANTLYLDSASFFLSVVSLLAIRKSFSAAALNRGSENTLKPNMFREIGEGLHYVWGHRVIRSISLFTMALNLSGSAATAVLMYHMQVNLHFSATWVGFVMAGLSVGTVSGSLVAGVVSRWLSMQNIMVLALAIQVIPMFVFAFSPWPYLLAAANFLLGFSGVNWNVQSLSLRQSVIPDNLLGRASSAIRMVVWGAMPLGSALGGAMGQLIGAPIVLVAAGVLQGGTFLGGLKSSLFRVRGFQTTADTETKHTL